MDRELTIDCPKCDGEGVIPLADEDGDVFLDELCELCEGEGWLDVTERDEE